MSEIIKSNYYEKIGNKFYYEEEYVKEQDKEIERLKGNIEILSDDLGNIGYMLGLEEGSCYEDVLEEIRKLQQKENIIKEVREEVRILESNCDISDYHAQKLYQTLDKEGVN